MFVTLLAMCHSLHTGSLAHEEGGMYKLTCSVMWRAWAGRFPQRREHRDADQVQHCHAALLTAN